MEVIQFYSKALGFNWRNKANVLIVVKVHDHKDDDSRLSFDYYSAADLLSASYN